MLAALGLLLSLGPAFSAPTCVEARTKASALRYQARQEARLGNHDRVCDTLDEIGDRYNDARDGFEDCGAGVIAIDLRTELRNLRIAKHVNRCD
jgi:hypothetical protein